VQGFRIYVDGVYRASLQAPQDYFQVTLTLETPKEP
jgi:hypothetical protein